MPMAMSKGAMCYGIGVRNKDVICCMRRNIEVIRN